MLSFSARRICLFVAACLLVMPTVSASSTGGAWAPVPKGGGVAAEPLSPQAEATDVTAAQDEEEEAPEGEGEEGEGEGEEDGEVVIPVPVPENDDDDGDTTTPDEPAPAPIVRDQGPSLPSTGRELAGPAATGLLFLVAGAALVRRRRV